MSTSVTIELDDIAALAWRDRDSSAQALSTHQFVKSHQFLRRLIPFAFSDYQPPNQANRDLAQKHHRYSSSRNRITIEAHT
jgi:hypothetical protein